MHEDSSCILRYDGGVRRELPPLNALRAFEAAARHLSFTRGAEELHVTQTAISHQVKALEGHLGVKLFRRLPRRLLLTDQGQTYARALREAFDRMHEATSRLHGAAEPNILTISVIPSFAARWLVPRLASFQAREPAIDVLLAPNAAAVDFTRESVDLGIRWGRGRYPGLRTTRLMGDELFPVCSPSLRRGRRQLRSPDDLAQHTLLHDDNREGWRRWLRAAGAKGVDASRGPIFTDSSLSLQAAIEGHGVALGRRVLADADLASGRLIAPFSLTLPSELAYYLVAPPHTADLPKVKAFRDWILAEISGVE
jgi:LysR family glycine cleavage system transcriptional activator